MPAARRFPPPWTIDEANDACFIVRGHPVYPFRHLLHDIVFVVGRGDSELLRWFQARREAADMATALLALVNVCSQEMKTSGPAGVERGLLKLGKLQHEEQNESGRSLGVEVSIFGNVFDVFLNFTSGNCMLSFHGCEKYAGFTARTFLPMRTVTIDLQPHHVHGVPRPVVCS